MTNKLLAILLILVISLSGCSYPSQPDTGQGDPGGVKAWFDAPLPYSEFVMPDPVQLVFHGSDPQGVSVFELSINGDLISEILSPSAADSLVTMTYEWEPTAPGTYAMTVRAKNNTGIWSLYAETVVTVLEPAIQQVITPTNPPTLTETPTQVPVEASATATSTVQPATITIERISTNLVYLGRGDCGPLEVTITARAIAPNGINVVVLFYRFAADGASANFESVSMNPIGDDFYQGTINPTSVLGGSVPFEQAALQYQAVIQQNNGDTSVRTALLSDISVEACGSVSSACSDYTDERSCIANGCQWALVPGIVPVYTCQNR